jgi:uncharacterized protein
MLLQFKVINYLSIRDEQILSFVASDDEHLKVSNIANNPLGGNFEVLNSAVIYGANASGKSNFLNALLAVRELVSSSDKYTENQLFNDHSFTLSQQTIQKPSYFEINFIVDNIRYEYSFSINTSQILSEKLLCYKNTKPQTWFSRLYNKETQQDEYVFGTEFKGQKTTWQNSTRKNSLFLSIATQLNSAQLGPIFNWFMKLEFILEGGGVKKEYPLNMLDSEKGKLIVLDFLKSADISIADIHTQKKVVRNFTVSVLLENNTNQIDKKEDMEITDVYFTHTNDEMSAVFSLDKESTGTRKLFQYIGGLFHILEQGKKLIIDEIENSLHPLIVKKIIQLFNNPELNRNGAQLLFTTHNTSLLDNDLFRRDQIWFIEKNSNLASKLYSLAEFNTKKNEVVEKSYLEGRYGALPFLTDFKG